jgi:hypothetical protein
MVVKNLNPMFYNQHSLVLVWKGMSDTLIRYSDVQILACHKSQSNAYICLVGYSVKEHLVVAQRIESLENDEHFLTMFG